MAAAEVSRDVVYFLKLERISESDIIQEVERWHAMPTSHFVDDVSLRAVNSAACADLAGCGGPRQGLLCCGRGAGIAFHKGLRFLIKLIAGHAVG